MRRVLLLLLSGCGVSSAGVGGETALEQDDGLQAARCAPYPWKVNVGAPAEDAARDALAKLSPEATMNWSTVRNTPAGIFQLGLELECPEGKDARELFFAFVAAHPDVFRLQPDEWAAAPMPCSGLPLDAQWVNTGRLTYAGQPARADVFAWRWRASKVGMVIEAVAGSWVPPASYVDTLALRRCASLDVKTADETVRKTKLPYTVFDWCAPRGSYEYSVAPADAFAVVAAAVFEWSEESGAVMLRKVHDARLVLDPSSYTPELLQSDANCPRPGGVPHLGFELSFDSVTGELLRHKPGVGCIVCLSQ